MQLIENHFNDFKVRIILMDGKEYFIAKDIAKILGYSDTDKAIRQHCKKSFSIGDFFNSDKMAGLDFPKDLGNNFKNFQLIPESDVWRLINKSRLPEAEKIEEWITEEVLPEIRKTGSYSVQKVEVEKFTPQTILEIVETGIQILTKFRELNPAEQIELDTFHKNKNGESLLEKFGKN
ncbi:prophage antirepressor, partial [Thiovulum sp. ES]